jgi:putative phosphoribosyl transferase
VIAVEQTVQIAAGDIPLNGDLNIPENSAGVVLFAHGSGSHSPRNRHVASSLQSRGFGTLLVDLLTSDEEAEDRVNGHLRFNIELLSTRLVVITDWLLDHPHIGNLGIGCFGASTGAAAALVAASRRPESIKAVVSRGGRPDLAGMALRRVSAPTLLIVGANDWPVIDMNRQALRELAAPAKRLEIVPHATHLFEEPGALESVAQLAGDWFGRQLMSSSP